MKSRNQQSVSSDSVWKNFEEIHIKINDLNFFFLFSNLPTTPQKQFYSYTTLQNLIFTWEVTFFPVVSRITLYLVNRICVCVCVVIWTRWTFDKLRAPTIPKGSAVLEDRRTCAAVSTRNSKRERQRQERVAIDTHGRGTNYISCGVDGAVLVIKSPSSHDDTRPSLREIIRRMNPWRGRLIPLNRSLQVHFVKRFKNDQFDMITRFSKSLIGCRKCNFHPLFFSFVARGIYQIRIRETLSFRNLNSTSKYRTLNLALSSII